MPTFQIRESISKMITSDFDRKAELDAFKRLNLTTVAADHGFSIVKKKSTRHSVLMKSSNDKIIVSKNGDHYVYCSVFDTSSNGTIIDFTTNVIERGASLGRVRQLLRPYLNGEYFSTVVRKNEGRFADSIKPSSTDFQAVAARMTKFEPITSHNHYLNDVRGIPLEMMLKDRLKGRVLHCPTAKTIVFPHHGSPTDDPGIIDRCVNGYEIKGQGVTMFSKGGRKGLWASAGFEHDKFLAVTESGLDALSYLALRKRDDIRVISLSGQLNSHQPELIRSAIKKMGQESTVIAAFDNDEAGDRMTVALAKIVASVKRPDISIKSDRPQKRGADWNEALNEYEVSKPIKRARLALSSYSP